MALLHGLLWPIQFWNDTVLKVGRAIAIVAIAAMVVAIIVQVFFRYFLGNALTWPDEFARFCMLWMTGLMAPLAYRRGGFVAIDMALEMIPKRAAALVSLFLLVVSGLVLGMAAVIGWAEVTGFGGQFTTDSLYLPLSLAFDEWFRVPRSWTMASIFVGMVLLFIVNLELILRALITLLGGAEGLKPIAAGAEELRVE
jgi:TRAP-type C4-dicarboxylate transport system permease small subunit